MKTSITTVVPLPTSDAGMQRSIVRFNNSRIGKNKISRRTAMFIQNKANGQWTIRYAMGNAGNVKGLTKEAIALDYDAVNELGITFSTPVQLEVKKSDLVRSMLWLATSPNLNVRLSFRFAILGAVLGLISLAISL